MSLVDSKKSIFVEIGAFTSLKGTTDLPNNTNTLSSINGKNEPVPFMLDMLKTLNGSESVKKSTGDLVNHVSTDAEPTLKTSLKTQVTQPNADQNLPSTFVNDGYDMSVKDVDVYGKYKTNPNSSTGDLLYNKNQNNFDSAVKQAINAPQTDIVYNNSIIRYDDTTDKINVKPTPSASNQKIGAYLNSFIDGLILIDKKEFTSNVLNSIFGTLTTKQGKTIEQVSKELKLENLINKSIEDADNLVINQNELNDINSNAEKIVNGTNIIDLCCGVITSSLPMSGFTNTIQSITGATTGYDVSNALQNGLDDSIKNTPNANVVNSNIQPVKDSFFTKIINAITTTLIKSVTLTPQIRVLIGIASAFQHGTPQLGDPVSDINKNKALVKCITKSSQAIVNKFFFNLVKKALESLIVPISKKIIKEKINNYTGILKSLTSL